jgi:hypothetical protein
MPWKIEKEMGTVHVGPQLFLGFREFFVLKIARKTYQRIQKKKKHFIHHELQKIQRELGKIAQHEQSFEWQLKRDYST